MENYRPYTGSTTRTHSRRREDKNRSPGLRLAFCMGIVTIAILIKFLFPGFSEKISSKISEKADFESAFTVIGEAISGEREIYDALEEAFMYAFAPHKMSSNEDGESPGVLSDTDVITV